LPLTLSGTARRCRRHVAATVKVAARPSRRAAKQLYRNAHVPDCKQVAPHPAGRVATAGVVRCQRLWRLPGFGEFGKASGKAYARKSHRVRRRVRDWKVRVDGIAIGVVGRAATRLRDKLAVRRPCEVPWRCRHGSSRSPPYVAVSVWSHATVRAKTAGAPQPPDQWARWVQVLGGQPENGVQSPCRSACPAPGPTPRRKVDQWNSAPNRRRIRVVDVIVVRCRSAL